MGFKKNNYLFNLGRADCVRQLHRVRVPVGGPDPAVHLRQAQGYPKVPRRSLREREDHRHQGRRLERERIPVVFTREP